MRRTNGGEETRESSWKCEKKSLREEEKRFSLIALSFFSFTDVHQAVFHE